MAWFWLLYALALVVAAAVYLWSGDVVGAVAGLALALGIVHHLRIGGLEVGLMSLRKRNGSRWI